MASGFPESDACITWCPKCGQIQRKTRSCCACGTGWSPTWRVRIEPVIQTSQVSAERSEQAGDSPSLGSPLLSSKERGTAMGTEKWDVFVDRILGEREYKVVRTLMEQANPHLGKRSLESLLRPPTKIGSAMSLRAANILMGELEENGIPTRKRRVAEEATADLPEVTEPGPQIWYAHAAVLILSRRRDFVRNVEGRRLPTRARRE